MKRSIANTYICIDAEGQAFPIIARTGNEAHNIARKTLRKANIVCSSPASWARKF